MFNGEWCPVSYLDPVTFESELSVTCPTMWTVELPLTFPLYSSEAWQAMKQIELPLFGCQWTSGVLLQIAVVQADPEGWSGSKQVSYDGVSRDQIILHFILENKLIPFTTEQVLKWLDHYGFRVKSGQEVEIWWYPRRFPLYSFQVDAMIKGTSALVNFLFAYSPLFLSQVSDPDGTMKDLLFTFVSHNKEEIAKKRCRRPARVRRVGRNRRLTTQIEEETTDDDSEDGKRAEPEPASGSDGRTTIQAEEEVDLENKRVWRR